MAKRPLLITLIGALYLLMGLTMVAAGIGVAFLDFTVFDPDLAGMGAVIGGSVLVFGLILLAIAYGFLKGWSVMWYLGVIFSALGALGSLLALPEGVFMLVINAVILYYLFRPQVKGFFKV